MVVGTFNMHLRLHCRLWQNELKTNLNIRISLAGVFDQFGGSITLARSGQHGVKTEKLFLSGHSTPKLEIEC